VTGQAEAALAGAGTAPAAELGAEAGEAAPVRVSRPIEARAFVSAPPAAQPAAEAPTPPAAPVAPVVPRFDLPLADLNALASAAGLQWVHSDAERVAQAQAQIASEPRPVHVPRERPALVTIDEGPLVLVETRKDLKQIKLPFDADATQQPH
jgi:ribonuclease E